MYFNYMTAVTILQFLLLIIAIFEKLTHKHCCQIKDAIDKYFIEDWWNYILKSILFLFDNGLGIHETFNACCCFCSVTKFSPTLCNPMCCSMPGLPVPHYLPDKFMSIKLVMLSNHLILCQPLFLLPSVFPSTRVFSSESTHTWLISKC